MNEPNKSKEELLKLLKETIEGIIINLEREIPSYKTKLAATVSKEKDNDLVYHYANVPLLLRLSMFDLAILFKYFIEAKTDTVANLFSRLMCSHLYEFIEDTPSILGKKYREVITNLNNSELVSELNQLLKYLNETKKSHRIFLKTIRNNISSHKDSDGLLQAKLMDEMTIEEPYMAFMEISRTFGLYIDFEDNLIKHIKKMK
jgi:uncharacterized protein YdiU (UPF0061 family)